jgi:class 3 adenylate cyclase/pimeloyl-ACP methyl ester carboxylesterase
MQPEVRYCTTSDGVRIAYTVTGDGPVFVSLIDPIVSHVGIEWSSTSNRRMLEEEARYFTLVRMDSRGSGLSQRVVASSVDETLRDIEAVVEHAGLGSFTLHANTSASQFAIAFAARHPELVSRLVLIDGSARAADIAASPQVAAFSAAAANDWETATEVIGAIAFGPGRDESRSHGEFVRACINQEDYLAGVANFAALDVTPLLPELSMPVLVVRHLGFRWITDEMTQDLVAAIPDARLVTVKGTWVDDVEGLTKRIADFVYGGDASRGARRTTDSGVRTVLFTDLVGHTEMMRRLGDASGRELLREHERMTRDAIAKHAGTEIKTDGDSFMVSFGSVAAAMECAVELQRAFARRNEAADEPLRVRMGLNAGEPIGDEGDLFGESVILAARIKDQACEGEILIAEPVRHLLAGKGFAFADRGTFVPKGFEDAVRLFEVRWRE